jgi:oligopeptide/dipeptide ABC transporter ATP-binding protein
MIAIALACGPRLLIADEPTTALDVRLQAEVLDLLRDLRQRFGLALLLITHDLGVAAETADRIAVMYSGRIVEQGAAGDVLARPLHPYTQGLLRSVPGGHPGARLGTIEGTVPTPGSPLPGCAFEPRCRDRLPVCAERMPDDIAVERAPGAPAHAVRCHLHRPR